MTMDDKEKEEVRRWVQGVISPLEIEQVIQTISRLENEIIERKVKLEHWRKVLKKLKKVADK